MKAIHLRLLFALLFLLASSRCLAQYEWQVTHDYKDDTTEAYEPRLLSCAGNHCTAFVYVGKANYNLFTILRSDDGGLSWRRQWKALDYGTPYFGYHYFFAIQQIDSLNVVAVGDSSHILRTFDGGATWQKQVSPPAYPDASLWGVHFHDPMNGIIAAPDRPLTTTDGGKHWNPMPFTRSPILPCHCYGPGKFAALCQSTGQIFRTSNNWATVDSTAPMDTLSIDHPTLWWTDWGEGDTIIAYGRDVNGGLIVRTSDGGKTWEKSKIDYPQGFYAINILAMSAIQDDTLVAGSDYPGHILISSDQGRSWRLDTISSPNPVTVLVNGIARPAPGVVLATTEITGFGSGVIVRGTIETSGVPLLDHTIGIATAYPNPASESVTINFTENSEPVYVVDVLGREMLRMPASTNGSLTFSTTSLPAGIYFVLHGMERARFVKE